MSGTQPFDPIMAIPAVDSPDWPAFAARFPHAAAVLMETEGQPEPVAVANTPAPLWPLKGQFGGPLSRKVQQLGARYVAPHMIAYWDSLKPRSTALRKDLKAARAAVTAAAGKLRDRQ